jgi:hypothetical protein
MNISRDNYEVFFLDFLEGNLRADMLEELQVFLQNNQDLQAELDEMKLFQDQMESELSEEPIVFDAKASLKKTEVTEEERLIDELLAKELEGDLTAEEKTVLAKLAAGTTLVDNWRRVYAMTRLRATSETFGEKDAVRIPTSIDHTTIHDLLIAHCEGDLTDEENLMLESMLASDEALRQEQSLYSLLKLKPEEVVFPAKDALYKKEAAVFSLRTFYYAMSAAASVALLIAILNWNDSSTATTAIADVPKGKVSNKSSQVNPASNNSSSDTQNSSAAGTTTNTSGNVYTPNYSEPQYGMDGGDVAHQSSPSKKDKPSKTIESFEHLPYQDGENLATLKPNKLEFNVPDMKKVYEEPIRHYQPSEETVTLMAFLGKAASSRITGTDAFIYTERQLEILSQRVNRNFVFERVPENTKDRVFLKIGRFELQKKVARKEQKDKTLWNKAKELISKKESK